MKGLVGWTSHFLWGNISDNQHNHFSLSYYSCFWGGFFFIFYFLVSTNSSLVFSPWLGISSLGKVKSLLPIRICLQTWLLVLCAFLIPLQYWCISNPTSLINIEILILFWHADYRQRLSGSQFGIPRDLSVNADFFFPFLPLHELQISSRPQLDFITITHSSWSSFNIWKDHLLAGNGQFFFLWLLKYNFQFLIWFI